MIDDMQRLLLWSATSVALDTKKPLRKRRGLVEQFSELIILIRELRCKLRQKLPGEAELVLTRTPHESIRLSG